VSPNDPTLRVLDDFDARKRFALPGDVEDFLHQLGDSAVLHVPGRDPGRVRAVATLIHGNEPSGVRAVHGWLRDGDVPATDVVIWIASVATALAPPGFAHRSLPGHRDLNRCFLETGASAEHRLAALALEQLCARLPEALIDLHNNTGHNPAYAVGPVAGPGEQALAAWFGRYFVHSDLALGALVEATAQRFPSVTIECGRAGSAEADAVARRGLERFLSAETLPAAPERAPQLLLDPVRVELRPDVSIAIGDRPTAGAGFTLAADVDRHNFERLAPGTPIGWLHDEAPWPLVVLDAGGEDVSHDYFARRGARLEARRELVPIMMTTQPAIARSDCLFYIVRPG
jgi:hypothetical protein